MRLTLYYHLYPGDYLKETLDNHLAVLSKSNFNEIIIHAYNINNSNRAVVQWFFSELRKVASVSLNIDTFNGAINEFSTLECLQQSLPLREDNEWIAYAHTKGVTHPRGSPIVKKSLFLLENLALLVKCIKKNKFFSNFYNVAGSDLVVANFDSFGPANPAFAGNIWIAKVSYLKSLPTILKYAKCCSAARYNAEGWIGLSNKSVIFNTFSPHRFHYDNHPIEIDLYLVESEMNHFLLHEAKFKGIQQYFEKVVSYQSDKLDSILERLYPRQIYFRRKLQRLIFQSLSKSPALFKMLSTISWKFGIAHSDFSLFYLDIPSHLEIYRYIRIEPNKLEVIE